MTKSNEWHRIYVSRQSRSAPGPRFVAAHLSRCLRFTLVSCTRFFFLLPKTRVSKLKSLEHTRLNSEFSKLDLGSGAMPSGAKKRKAEKKKKEQLGGNTGTDHATSHGAHHCPFSFALTFFDLYGCFFFFFLLLCGKFVLLLFYVGEVMGKGRRR